MRLFVSVDLDGMADAVTAVQERFADASGLRYSDPAQAHVTLKFLGDVDRDRLPALEEELAAAVEAADVAPFTATVGGLGVFPSLDYISVVWVGFQDGGTELTALHEAIEERTVAMGFDPEDHDFTPHVTIARMDHAGGKELVQDVVTGEDPTLGDLAVEEVRLTESSLTSDGPVYETRTRFPLEE